MSCSGVASATRRWCTNSIRHWDRATRAKGFCRMIFVSQSVCCSRRRLVNNPGKKACEHQGDGGCHVCARSGDRRHTRVYSRAARPCHSTLGLTPPSSSSARIHSSTSVTRQKRQRTNALAFQAILSTETSISHLGNLAVLLEPSPESASSALHLMFSDRKASFKTPPAAVKETLTSQEARRNRVRAPPLKATR